MASGCSDAGYEALRALRKVSVEAGTLVESERALFLVVATILLEAGAGPLTLLAVYVASNLLTVIVAGIAVNRWSPRPRATLARFWDGEARPGRARPGCCWVLPHG